MSTLYLQFQDVLTYACLFGLLGIAAWAFVCRILPTLWDRIVLGLAGGRNPVNIVLVLLFVIPICYHGMTKVITYDGGIVAGDTQNLVSNDTVNLYWKRDPRRPVPLPLDSPVYIDYRPSVETNADWGLLAQTTVGAWEWHGTLPDATNYDYNIWAYYIPPAPHTNGVWEWKTTYSRDGKHIVPFHDRIELNGKAIFGPDQKRMEDNP